MVGMAQLASAPDCGSGGRGFESLYPPLVSWMAIFLFTVPHGDRSPAVLRTSVVPLALTTPVLHAVPASQVRGIRSEPLSCEHERPDRIPRL